MTGSLEVAAATHLNGLTFAGDGENPKSILGVARVGLKLAEAVAEYGAVASVRQVGGLIVTWQTLARLSITVYAGSYADVWAAQAAIQTHLGTGWRPSQGSIRFDSWKNESAGAEQAYPGDLAVVASIWRVTTRQLPA